MFSGVKLSLHKYCTIRSARVSGAKCFPFQNAKMYSINYSELIATGNVLEPQMKPNLISSRPFKTHF